MEKSSKKPGLWIGIDTGGTFTDLIIMEFSPEDPENTGKTHIVKVPSTPQNPAKAILNGLNKVEAFQKKRKNYGLCHIIHGSTVATNAILERRGAKTALITTRGFRDILAIGRQTRPDLYKLDSERPPPLISRKDSYEVSERILATGEINQEIDSKDLNKVCEAICRGKYQSVAVCLLHAYANPSHETRIANALGKSFQKNALEDLVPQISLSSKILPQFREFERFSTTVLSAYVQPVMTHYLHHLYENIQNQNEKSLKLTVMRSDGGQFPLHEAQEKPLHTVLSGPAGGIIGSKKIAENAGFENIITFDMGGTSTDVSLLPQEILKTQESEINGMPIRLPMIDIHTVGAGGGSLVRVDKAGALRVGPESAGAHPGPICYGEGKELTLTDIHLFLGRLDPKFFLGGKLILDTDSVQLKMQKMAKRLRTSSHELAQIALELAELRMEQAIRVISIERGYDPRDFTLICFGGAGGLHCVNLARRLLIPRILIPPHPGGLSAYGMLFSDLSQWKTKTLLLASNAIDYEELRERVEGIFEEIKQPIADEGIPPEKILTMGFLEMRYIGQSFELSVPLSRDFIKHFHQLHQIRYGYCDEEKPTEIVNIFCEASGARKKPSLPYLGALEPKEGKKFLKTERKTTCFYDGKKYTMPIYFRNNLYPGSSWEGPALITEYSATSFMPPGCYARVDRWGNMIIELKD